MHMSNLFCLSPVDYFLSIIIFIIFPYTFLYPQSVIPRLCALNLVLF
jgi:hypothetical protein